MRRYLEHVFQSVSAGACGLLIGHARSAENITDAELLMSWQGPSANNAAKTDGRRKCGNQAKIRGIKKKKLPQKPKGWHCQFFPLIFRTMANRHLARSVVLQVLFERASLG